jgi:phage baseplate assembly protein V
MFRAGLVKQQDVQGARVRVAFPDRDQMLSYWLPVLFPKTQSDKIYWLPDVGEQVVCLMDERDEAGAVIGAIYSSADLPPAASADKYRVTFKDGAIIEYDRAAHVLSATLPDGATLTLHASGATLSIDSSGNVTVRAAGGISLVTSAHSNSVDGMIDTYNTHTHSDPQGGSTGTPGQQMP